MALSSITVNNGVTLHGRALARNGKVTLIHDTITSNTCFKSGGGSLPATDTAAPTATKTSGSSSIFLLVPFLVALVVVLSRRSGATGRNR